MCMVFDMNGAGLAQMDMDLIRFIVNAFKIYYPNLLSWMLIFNMPWILQGQCPSCHGDCYYIYIPIIYSGLEDCARLAG